VCRAWHDASSFDDDQEQLRLLLDLDNLSAADLATSWAWLRLHGSCVTGLSISSEAQPCWPAMEQLLLSPAIMGNQLTRLELLGKDTLVPLAPHLPRLPCLQYLGASITAGTVKQQGAWSLGWTCGENVYEAPDLGQLCPQLVGLHLTMDGRGMFDSAAFTAKHEFGQLLPVSLEELHLEGGRSDVNCRVLTHLTSLTRLTIDAQDITHGRCAVQAQGASWSEQSNSHISLKHCWTVQIGGGFQCRLCSTGGVTLQAAFAVCLLPRSLHTTCSPTSPITLACTTGTWSASPACSS
jgi:hypothetical protein